MKSTQHVTVEGTHKRYKLLSLISILAIIYGILACLFAPGPLSILIAIVGLLGFFASKAAVWWNHS